MRCNASPNLQGAAGADADGADDNLPVFELNEQQRRILAERDIVADIEQVPAALQQIDAVVNVDALADTGTEGSQNRLLKFGPFEQPPRHQPHRLLHDPVAHIEAAPHRCSRRLVTADQQLLSAARRTPAVKIV